MYARLLRPSHRFNLTLPTTLLHPFSTSSNSNSQDNSIAKVDQKQWIRAPGGGKPPPVPDIRSITTGTVGVCGGMTAVSCLHHLTDLHDYTLVLGSFGATCMLLFGAHQAPFAQPRNVIGGHVISCLCGIIAYEVLGSVPAVAAPVGVAAAYCSMQLTNTTHPPAGGTCLLAIMGPQRIMDMGFELLIPTGVGSIALVACAIVYNNMVGKKYPHYW